MIGCNNNMEKKLFASLKCTDIGYSDCSHISYGVIEETLLRNLKYHVIKSHGHTDQSWEEELSKKIEDFRRWIKLSEGAC
jgi:predicted small metal-binding protein